MKVIYIEDQNLLASTLVKVMNQIPDMEIVAQSDKASDAFRLCQIHHPDLVIMDIFTNDGNGIESTVLIKKFFPQIKVLILTGVEEDWLVKAAEEAGADLFARKNLSLNELTDLIQYARMPYRVFPQIQADTEKTAIFSELEIKIIRLLALGKSSKEIAAELFLGYGTVRVYISRMYATTGLKSRAQLVAYALRNNMISTD
jgi:DNA-binding NarL/FixJ family response regulator